VATAIKYKRVTNSGDHVSVISDDTLELDNCSPNNDTFFNKNILTGTSSGEEETAQRFPLKSPRSNHFLSTDICGPVKCTPAGRRYIIVFVCLSSGVYFASTSRTQVVGTPAVNKDVDAYASYQANFASVPDLPVSPTKLVYDIVNPKTNFDVTGLAPWYNFNDHGLTPVVQLQPLSYNSTCHPGPAAADANQPAIQLQPESDCDSLWTTFTRYVSDASPLLPSHFKAVRYVIAPWNQGNLGGLYSLFSANTAASRSGGGRGAYADCEAIISAVNKSPTNSNTDLNTVVYDPDMHLQPQDVPTSRIVFANTSTSKLSTIVPPQGHRTPRNHALPETPFWKIATDKEMTSIKELNVMAQPPRGAEIIESTFMYKIAVDKEMTSIEELNVMAQPPRGAEIIESTFVYKIKTNPDDTIEKFKVRLVTLGNHHKYGETFPETYAPGTQLSSSRLILYLAIKKNIELKHMDVHTAYLQSKLTGDHDDIWIRLPFGFKNLELKHMDVHTAYFQSKLTGDHDDIWSRLPFGFKPSSDGAYGKHLRPLYGVRQAGHEWYFSNRDFILNQDFHWKQSTVEAQLYYTIDPKTGLFCEIFLHTDNYFCTYSDDVLCNDFLTDWNMNDTDSPVVKGLNLPIDATANSKFRYCALVGALLWIATCTRPGILFAITYLSRLSTYATKIHWDALVQVLLCLKTTLETPFVLELTDITSKDKCNVIIAADSDWGQDIVDRKSFSGHRVIIDGAFINSITAKQPPVSTSSTKAEYISASDACRKGLYFRNMLSKATTVILPIEASLVNIGADCITQNYVNNSRIKHIDAKSHMIRDWTSKKIFELFYIENNENLDNTLIKALADPVRHGLVQCLLGGHLLP